MIDFGLASRLLHVQQGYGWHMYGGHHMAGGYWGYFPFVHVIFWLLVLAAIAGLIILAGRYLGSKGPSENGGSSALDQLDERYARGEIEREEYLQRKKDIMER